MLTLVQHQLVICVSVFVLEDSQTSWKIAAIMYVFGPIVGPGAMNKRRFHILLEARCCAYQEDVLKHTTCGGCDRFRTWKASSPWRYFETKAPHRVLVPLSAPRLDEGDLGQSERSEFRVLLLFL